MHQVSGRVEPFRVSTGFEFVLKDFLTEGVSVNAKHLGGTRQIAVLVFQDLSDESLLELAPGLSEANSLADHFCDERFELVFEHRVSPARLKGQFAR